MYTEIQFEQSQYTNYIMERHLKICLWHRELDRDDKCVPLMMQLSDYPLQLVKVYDDVYVYNVNFGKITQKNYVLARDKLIYEINTGINVVIPLPETIKTAHNWVSEKF